MTFEVHKVSSETTDGLFRGVGERLGFSGLTNEGRPSEGRLYDVCEFASIVSAREHGMFTTGLDGLAATAAALERYAAEMSDVTLEALRRRADAGDPQAMLCLSDALTWGFLGADANSPDGNLWQRRACEMRHIPALVNGAAMSLRMIRLDKGSVEVLLKVAMNQSNIAAVSGYEAPAIVAVAESAHKYGVDFEGYEPLLYAAARHVVRSPPPAALVRPCNGPGCTVRVSQKYLLRQCVACGVTKYCSKECQLAHWPFHKQACKLARKQQQQQQQQQERDDEEVKNDDDDATTAAQPNSSNRRAGKKKTNKKKTKKHAQDVDVGVGASSFRFKGSETLSAREFMETMKKDGIPENFVSAGDKFAEFVENYLDTFTVNAVCLWRAEDPEKSMADFASGRHVDMMPVFHRVCLIKQHRPREFDAYDTEDDTTVVVRAEDLCLSNSPIDRSADLRFQSGDLVDVKIADTWRPATILACYGIEVPEVDDSVYDALVLDGDAGIARVPHDSDTVVRKRRSPS